MVVVLFFCVALTEILPGKLGGSKMQRLEQSHFDLIQSRNGLVDLRAIVVFRFSIACGRWVSSDLVTEVVGSIPLPHQFLINSLAFL